MSGRQVKQARVIPIATRRRINAEMRKLEAEHAEREAQADAATMARIRSARQAWAWVALALFLACVLAAVFG